MSADRRRRHTSTTSAPTSSSPAASVRHAPAGRAAHPAGLGRARPGAKAGSSTSTSTVRRPARGPPPRARRRRSPDAEVAHVVREEARDPAPLLPAELRLARPVAAQPDLYVTRRVDEPLLDQPEHRRPVRELAPVHLARRCRCGCRSGRALRARARAQARCPARRSSGRRPGPSGSRRRRATSPTAPRSPRGAPGSCGTTGASP